jgi:hypothetical protein
MEDIMDQNNIQTPVEGDEKYLRITENLDETIAAIQEEWAKKFDTIQRPPGFVINKFGNKEETE